MKKIIILNIAALFIASVSFAAITSATSHDISSTFANAGLSVKGDGGPVASTNAANIGKLSTKVELAWKCDPNGYAIYTQHQQGTKAFGTSYDSTSIYTKDATAGTPVGPTMTTGSDSFTGWTTM